jgi:hypothetical protein
VWADSDDYFLASAQEIAVFRHLFKKIEFSAETKRQRLSTFANRYFLPFAFFYLAELWQSLYKQEIQKIESFGATRCSG